MKTIGLIGGMSWESTLEYYRIINEEVKTRLGGSHSAKCLIYSFDFHEVEVLQHNGEWDKLTEMMVDEAKNLKKAGADFIVICTNTMHLMADDIKREAEIEVIHIADAAACAIKDKKISKVALLGTKFTMEGAFYRDVLEKRHNIDVVIPEIEDREIVHNIIYDELIMGNINDISRQKYVTIINKMKKQGAEGVVLGCTEIPLLIKQRDVDISVFDTTDIHAKAAVDKALEN